MYVYITRKCQKPLILAYQKHNQHFNSNPHLPHQDETQVTPHRPSSAVFLSSARSRPTSNRMAPRTRARPPHCAGPRSTDVLSIISQYNVSPG